MTEVLRPAEDVQATSASPSRRAQGRQRDHRGGLAPVPTTMSERRPDRAAPAASETRTGSMTPQPVTKAKVSKWTVQAVM